MKSTLSRRLLLLLVVLVGCFGAPLLAQQSRAIYTFKSKFQNIAIIDTADDHRLMIFDGKFDGTDPIQSEMDKKKPNSLVLTYTQHMITALPLAAKRDRILVVGLGGACLQRYLHELLPDSVIESAELDPAVVDCAKRFFNFKEDARQKVTVGDGRKFIADSKDKYDIIMLDAYGATSIPYMLATKEFLTLCRDHLTEGGLVCANIFYEVPEYPDMLKTYAEVFPEWHVMRCPHSTNAVLVALPTKQDITPEEWIDLAKLFDNAHPTGLKIASLVDHGIEAATRIPTDAKVLLDADEDKHK